MHQFTFERTPKNSFISLKENSLQFLYNLFQTCLCVLTDTDSSLSSENNPECMGAVWGLVGKLKVHPSLEDYLVLIRECERIGELPDPRGSRYPVYRIKSVALIPISPSPPVLDPPLKSCPKHHVGNVDAHSFEGAEGGQSSRFPFKALGGKISQVRDSLKNTAGSAATGIAAQVVVYHGTSKQ